MAAASHWDGHGVIFPRNLSVLTNVRVAPKVRSGGARCTGRHDRAARPIWMRGVEAAHAGGVDSRGPLHVSVGYEGFGFQLRDMGSSLIRRIRQHPVGVCALLIMVLYWPCVASGYLMDDFVHLWMLEGQGAPSPRDPWGLLNLFDFTSDPTRAAMPWWASESIQTRFWRPLATLFAFFDHLVAPGRAWFAHCHNIAWLIACVASLRFLLQETCDQGQKVPSWITWMTLLIFAGTCTHALPTLWIANRGALIATALSWCAIGFYARGQRTRFGWVDFGSTLCLSAALMAGEIAWVGVIQWLAFAIWGDVRSWPKKLSRSVPQFLVVVLWGLGYSIHGFGAQGGGFYLHPLSDFWLFVQAAPLRFAQLVAHALAFVPVELTQSEALRTAVVIAGGALFLLVVGIYHLVMPHCSPNHRRSLKWMSLGGVLGMAPILGAQPNDRLLVPIMLSSSFFFATLIRYLGQRRKQSGHRLFLSLGVLRHFLLAPALTLVVTLTMANKSVTGQKAMESFEAILPSTKEPRVRMMLNSPGPSMAWSLEEHLDHLRPGHAAKNTWIYGASTKDPLRLHRTGPQSLTLESLRGGSLSDGFYGQLLRTPLDKERDPLRPGKVIERPHYRVVILAIDAKGAATKVRLQLSPALSLDDLEIYAWGKSGIKRVELPPIGKETRFDWVIGPMEI